jgi:hypothetical protein
MIPKTALALTISTLLLSITALQAHGSCVVHDDLSQFVCRYGKPDIDDSTENDRPRPPIVTRMLTYKKEGVRAAYVPDAKAGTPPPYRKWKLIGFQDPTNNAVLSAAEVVRRMQGRDTKK